MKKWLRIIPGTTLIIVIVFLFHGIFYKNEPSFMKLPGEEEVSFEEVIQDLSQSKIVFLGEMHDRREHHRTQLKIIQALNENRKDVAIGMEMFMANSQKDLDRWVQGDMEESEFKKLFAENWGHYYDLYRGILLYARDNSLPLVGLNIPREITRQVAMNGVDSLSKEQAKEIEGVTCDVDGKYEEFIQRALGEHVHGEGDFQRFCEAQMVWDSVMAINIISYLDSNPAHSVVVIAGSGHSWKRGIPQQVNRRSELPFRVILPEVANRWDRESFTVHDTDYVVLGI